jgi:hypothetical protein
VSRKQDAKNLKASPLLASVLHDFRELLIERWEGADDAEKRESVHAGVKTLKELIEALNDRIDEQLGDERDDGATEG